MKKIKGTVKVVIGVLLAAITTTACDKSVDDEALALERYAKAHPVGSSPEVWLELHNTFGEWEKVALVVGYYHDRAGCEDIARLLQNEFGREYRCSPII